MQNSIIKTILVFLLSFLVLIAVFSCMEDDVGYTGECKSDSPSYYKDRAGAKMLFEFDYGNEINFFKFPFPNDYRMDSDATVALSGYPGETLFLINKMVDVADDQLKGFGTYSAVFITFDSPIDPTSLPQTAAESITDASSVILVNLTTGERVPILVKFWPERSNYNPANMVSAAPFYGFPMQEDSEYALIIKRSVTDINGNPLGAPKLFEQIKCGVVDPGVEPSQALVDVYAPLRSYVENDNSITSKDIAAATVFTTQKITSDMAALRTAVRSITPPSVSNLSIQNTYTDYVRYQGEIEIPIYQTGTPPYSSSGGEIVFNNGVPQQVTTEVVDFTLTIPTSAQPTAGYPIAVYQHGTGGDYLSFHYNGAAEEMAEEGIAVVGISQPLHYGRDGYDAVTLDLNVFNVNNPIAFRDNVRQSAAEVLFLVYLIEQGVFDVPDAISGVGDIGYDNNNIVFFGHSQGSLTGPPALSVEPNIKGALLSGCGGGLRDTLLYKIKPEINFLTYSTIPEAVAGALGIPIEELTIHHPVINLMQMGGEVSDTINFAPHFVKLVDEEYAKDIMITIGIYDTYVPPILTHSTSVAAGANPVSNSFYPFQYPSWTEGLGPDYSENPYDIAGLSVLNPPASNNLTNDQGITRTVVAIEYEQGSSDGHFVVFNEEEAIDQYTRFFYSLVNDENPTLYETTAP